MFESLLGLKNFKHLLNLKNFKHLSISIPKCIDLNSESKPKLIFVWFGFGSVCFKV